MGATFSDITLYTPTPYKNNTPEYWEETSLKNFVCDLYVQKMHGYKPPQATRVTLQPAYYNIWDRTWKNGSIFSIAPLFEREKYEAMNKREKYQYILDIVQSSMLQLSEEYKWDKEVFERAYREIIDCNFSLVIDYPTKRSRDKKKQGKLVIEKTESTTTVFAVINTDNQSIKRKIFDKQNWYWYDSAYEIVKHNKWLDNNRFGVQMKDLNFSVWYSLNEDKVLFEVKGEAKKEYDLKRMFTL
ncbi:MAG: hypothetical protein ACTHOF_12525 [Flavisolibacter sp.]|jgi:hypothetical protein